VSMLSLSATVSFTDLTSEGLLEGVGSIDVRFVSDCDGEGSTIVFVDIDPDEEDETKKPAQRIYRVRGETMRALGQALILMADAENASAET
jgi:hypothetical protein